MLQLLTVAPAEHTFAFTCTQTPLSDRTSLLAVLQQSLAFTVIGPQDETVVSNPS
jgi:hypothetical protein